MILSHLKSQPYDGKFRSYDLETKDFNLVLNLEVVFLGAAGLWFVSNACGKDWLRLHFLCMKTVFMSENQATHDEIILLQVSIMVHLVLELINQHGPSFLHSLLNKSLRRGNKLHGKFLALVFSDWQRQANLRNPWSSIKSLVERKRLQYFYYPCHFSLLFTTNKSKTARSVNTFKHHLFLIAIFRKLPRKLAIFSDSRMIFSTLRHSECRVKHKNPINTFHLIPINHYFRFTQLNFRY